MAKGNQRHMPKHDKPAPSGTVKRIATVTFGTKFLNPLMEDCRSVQKGQGHTLPPEAIEKMRSQVMHEHQLNASVPDAKRLKWMAIMMIHRASVHGTLPSVKRLKDALTKLCEMLSPRNELKLHMPIPRSLTGNPQEPSWIMAKFQNAVHQVLICVLDVLLTFKVKPSRYSSARSSSNSDHMGDEEATVKVEVTKGLPHEKRARGKRVNHYITLRDEPGCPYGFPPDRKSIKNLVTGKVYAFAGNKTIILVNRLTGGMTHDDWFVPLSGGEINHLRNTCREFFTDCVVLEEYKGKRSGNRKWSGRAKLKK